MMPKMYKVNVLYRKLKDSGAKSGANRFVFARSFSPTGFEERLTGHVYNSTK
jgi:hypothetical protein